MKKTILGGINWTLILGGLAGAVANYERLATPDTVAVPVDYLAYVGGPASASILALLWRIVRQWLDGFSVPPPGGNSPVVAAAVDALGREAGRLASAGNDAGAAAVLDAIARVQGKPVYRPDRGPSL